MDKRVKHGMSKSKEFLIWNSMLMRCSNPNMKNYKDYGGRGITVCERWNDFSNFYADIGDKPEGGSLERKDNNGNYEPDNCRWATKAEQAHNRRLYRTSNSGIAGVRFVEKTQKWTVRINANRKEIHVGVYTTFEEAVVARKKAEKTYWTLE